MNNKVRNLVFAAIIAALYSAVTLTTAPIAFGAIQLRLAEVLNLFAFINPVYGVGVILGCFISNFIASPFGMLDVMVGTLSTAAAIFCVTKTKNLFIASVWPTLWSACVGFMIWYLDPDPAKALLIFTVLSVMAGQFAVVTCIGYPMVRYIVGNEKLKQIFNFQFAYQK